jgi:hypothetical protein
MEDPQGRAWGCAFLALTMIAFPLFALGGPMSDLNAFLFLVLGVFNIAFASWLLGYAAYWFLLVLDETAGGRNDVKVEWPDEGYRQRLWKLAHLAFLAIIWGLPVFALFHYNEPPVRPALQSLVVVLAVGVVLWLMMPISLLSSMTGETHWEFFRWFVIRRLLKRGSVWLEFYASTFPLLLGCAIVAYLSIFNWKQLREEVDALGMPWLLTVVDVWLWGFVPPLTAIMAATALLIYARLLGRLAWMADLWEEEEEEEEEEEAKSSAPQSAELERMRADHDILEPATAVETPGAIPFAEEPRPVPVVRVATPEPGAGPLPVPQEPSPPRRLWVRGIYHFPWYRGSLKAWLFLALFGLLLSIALRLQVWLVS